jgi:hypothetical protein
MQSLPAAVWAGVTLEEAQMARKYLKKIGCVYKDDL